MSVSKIRIKLGAIEVEYEGSDTFLKEELPVLLNVVSELYQKSHSTDSPQINNQNSVPSASPKTKIQSTTNSLAGKLQVKTGPDLVMAAAAKLNFVDETEVFSRQKLIDEMKTSSAYYKSSYVGNLTKILNGLVKDGKLNEPTQDNFALTAKSIQDLESRLA